MDSGFEERKKKHENKWALDEELKFKAMARRNKLFGRWAASEMGMATDEAEAYAKGVVAADVRPGGALGKVKTDLAASGLLPGEDELRQKLSEFEVLAREDVPKEG